MFAAEMIAIYERCSAREETIEKERRDDGAFSSRPNEKAGDDQGNDKTNTKLNEYGYNIHNFLLYDPIFIL